MFLCTEWSAQVLLGGWNEEREVSTGLQDMEVTGVLSSGNETPREWTVENCNIPKEV